MNVSIQQLIDIRQRDFNVLNRAFSVGLGENYTNINYVLTNEDAKKVAIEIEKICDESEQDNDIFPLTEEQKIQNIKEANIAAESFRDLVYNFFKL